MAKMIETSTRLRPEPRPPFGGHLSLGAFRLTRGAPTRRLSAAVIDSGAVTSALDRFSELLKTSFKVILLFPIPLAQVGRFSRAASEH